MPEPGDTAEVGFRLSVDRPEICVFGKLLVAVVTETKPEVTVDASELLVSDEETKVVRPLATRLPLDTTVRGKLVPVDRCELVDIWGAFDDVNNEEGPIVTGRLLTTLDLGVAVRAADEVNPPSSEVAGTVAPVSAVSNVETEVLSEVVGMGLLFVRLGTVKELLVVVVLPDSADALGVGGRLVSVLIIAEVIDVRSDWEFRVLDWERRTLDREDSKPEDGLLDWLDPMVVPPVTSNVDPERDSELVLSPTDVGLAL